MRQIGPIEKVMRQRRRAAYQNDKRYRSLDELPVSDWVSQVAEGEATYVRKNAAVRNVKKDYLDSRRHK